MIALILTWLQVVTANLNITMRDSDEVFVSPATLSSADDLHPIAPGIVPLDLQDSYRRVGNKAHMAASIMRLNVSGCSPWLLVALALLPLLFFVPHFRGRPFAALRHLYLSAPTCLKPHQLITTWHPFHPTRGLRAGGKGGNAVSVEGKVAMVMGADGGVGFETCVALLESGADVWMGVKDEAARQLVALRVSARLGQDREVALKKAIQVPDGKKLPHWGRPQIFPLDVSSLRTTLDSYRGVHGLLREAQVSHLSYLINTVGVGFDSPAIKGGKHVCGYTENEDGIEYQLGINAVNAWVFVLLLWPFFTSPQPAVNEKQESEQEKTLKPACSRIIFTSSVAHAWATLPLSLAPRHDTWEQLREDGRKRWNAGRYSFSKLTQLHLLCTLSSLPLPLPLSLPGSPPLCPGPAIFALHPGEVLTPFLATMLPTWWLTLPLRLGHLADWFFCLSPSRGAWTGLYACVVDVDNNEKDKSRRGWTYLSAVCNVARPSTYAEDAVAARKCWELLGQKVVQRLQTLLEAEENPDGQEKGGDWVRQLVEVFEKDLIGVQGVDF